MSLSQKDATRILRFCLGADDSATAGPADDGGCVVTVALCRSSYEVHSFDAPTYEEALRAAASAGVLKQDCVDKQIAFVLRRDGAGDLPPASPALGAVSSLLLVPPPEADRSVLFLDTARSIGALLHEIQRERGVSSLYTGSDGKLYGSELVGQRGRTDARRATVAALAGRTGPGLPAPVVRRLKRAEALIAGVASLRSGIDDRLVPPARVIEVYTAANTELLAAVDACMVATVEGPRRSTALACVALLHAKEKTGIERARVSAALLSHHLADERVAVASLIASQASYLHIFSAAAPPAAEQLLRRLLASPPAIVVRRIEEQMVADPPPADARLEIDPREWFTAMSRKIEMLADVGEVALGFFADG